VIITTFFTNSLYREYASRLDDSARRQGLETDVVDLDSLGNWKANASRVPAFIKSMIEKHAGENILFLHADCLVRNFPDILIAPESRYCMAAYFISPGRPRSSTLWVRPCEESIAVLDDWTRLIEERQPDEPDHVLGEAMRKRAGYNFIQLPPSYAWVEKYMRRSHGGTEPVIEHFRASEGSGL
jgi:hypothetical protein